MWQAIEPLLPVRPPDRHPLGCPRQRIADRDCFEAILFRLVTGCSWDVAGRLGKGGETKLRNRCNAWSEAGVFDTVVDEAITGYDRIVGLDLSEVALDGSVHKAPMGGEGSGKSPVDRGKVGWKWSIATDRAGIPIGWAADGANRHDSILVALNRYSRGMTPKHPDKRSHAYQAHCHWTGSTGLGYEHYDRTHTASAPPASPR